VTLHSFAKCGTSSTLTEECKSTLTLSIMYLIIQRGQVRVLPTVAEKAMTRNAKMSRKENSSSVI
jgi:hypothetical protein